MLFIFFFNDTATTEIYTLSLHDALPIYRGGGRASATPLSGARPATGCRPGHPGDPARGNKRREMAHRQGVRRSEEHTSELQSPDHLVCRLLLEKKKKKQ